MKEEIFNFFSIYITFGGIQFRGQKSLQDKHKTKVKLDPPNTKAKKKVVFCLFSF